MNITLESGIRFELAYITICLNFFQNKLNIPNQTKVFTKPNDTNQYLQKPQNYIHEQFMQNSKCKSIKISKDKACQVKACPELGTAQPWIVYSFSYLAFPKPIAQAAKCKGYDPLGKEKARDCRDKEQDSHDEHLQDLRRVEHQDHMVSISLVLQCFYRIRTGQIQTMR